MQVEDSDQEPEEEDPNANTDDFKRWLAWTSAHVRYLHCLLKLADRIDLSSQFNDDAEFEDMDDSGDENGPVVDIDQIKIQCLSLISLPQVLEYTKPIP